ncbi:MAG: hypothetical protein ACYTCU_01205 [Planctomycetota bacterium]|jgi:hypothetical protein
MQTITRQQAIDRLRGKLLQLTDEEHSICEVASEKGLFCHGFSQWTFEELKERYWWLVKSRPDISREELERLANIWQVARCTVMDTSMACDTQTAEHDTCKGWDEWDNAALANYIDELCHEKVMVIDRRR